MKKIISFAVVTVLASVAMIGCGSKDTDGGDPSKAPRVEEIKDPGGNKSPEAALAEKHAKGRAARQAEADGGR